MRVSQLAKDVAETTVFVGPDPEDTVTVQYNPGNLTLETADQLKEVAQKAQASPGDLEGIDFKVIDLVLLPILVGWDLEDEDGSPLPLNTETLRKVPLAFLGKVLHEISQDMLPNPQTSGSSRSTSPSTDVEAPARIGSFS